MGDDPIIPGVSSSANGNTIINHYSLTTGQLVTLVAVAGLALGIAIGSIVIASITRVTMKSDTQAMIEASERRTMDRAVLAEREARIARDETDRMKVILESNGIRMQSH